MRPQIEQHRRGRGRRAWRGFHFDGRVLRHVHGGAGIVGVDARGIEQNQIGAGTHGRHDRRALEGAARRQQAGMLATARDFMATAGESTNVRAIGFGRWV